MFSKTKAINKYQSDSDLSTEYLSDDPDFNLPSTSKIKSNAIPIAFLKNPFKCKKNSEMADPLQLSLNQRTGLVGSIAVEGGAKLNDLILSRDTIRRASKDIRSETAQNIKGNFNAPKHCVLHWNGEILKEEETKGREILAIHVSGYLNL